jgi:hypothetical protein
MSSQQQKGASPLPCTPRPVTSSMQAPTYKQSNRATTGTHVMATAMQQHDSICDAQLCLPAPCQQHRAKLLPPNRRAIPSPHRAAHRAKPHMPDQAATSSPAPSHVPRARPRKHAIASHQYIAAASRRPPRSCHCPGSLSIASLPVGSCPTAPPSRRVDSPSRMPPAELPEPPLTQERAPRARLRPAEPPSRSYKATPSLSTAPRTSQLAPSLSLASQRHHQSHPPPSSVLAQRKIALVDLPLRAAPAQGEPGTSIPIHSSLSLCPWI